ncbi:MAG: hypothetical protein L6R36_005995 [Xanthoria steineri]|nr:MAG: hypothetical protein L6R36_005995 [Xanthoria steineri]
MRTFEETCERWDATFGQNSKISDLRTAVKDTNGQSPSVKGLRSICWKAFILFENLDQSTWTKTLADSRSAYGTLRDHFLKDIEHPDNISADPLTADDSSPWTILRHDEELRAEILQDVERCMPENLYFREPATQSMLLDILFIYCKLNPDVGYRQGMHEVLAPILWVISRDAVDLKVSSPTFDEQNPKHRLIGECFDGRFAEHDTFTLFGIVMQTVKSFYEVGTIPALSSSAPSSSPIVERSRRVHEVYLHQADAELATHLTSIEILPQIFLIRWIRLLFGREFPFDHVLALWDAIFAEDPTLDLIDLVCVSMLLRIRWQLLDADYSEALTLLLRYPVPEPPNDPSTFVSDALYLRQTIMQGGGAHIVSKYSGKSPGVESGSRTPKSNSAKMSDNVRRAISPSFSPGRSAAKFLQEQGGIDHMIQEAAKGVYSRGEKWGVNRALRGAMEGLQSGTNPPRKQADGSRWSLDEGQIVPSISEVTAKLASLEQRNKALAKLLGTAMEELWDQQRKQSQEKEDVLANALSVATAKVQFVQVYLENSSMPFSMEASTAEANVTEEQQGAIPTDTTPGGLQAIEPPSEKDRPKVEEIDAHAADTSLRNIQEAATGAGNSSAAAEPKITVSKSRPQAFPFHNPRPSLAQSSFSWMLGEDQRKSSFVSPSPFPSDRRAARERAGFLFGEGKNEAERKTAKGKVEDESEDEEIITLGTMKGHR